MDIGTSSLSVHFASDAGPHCSEADVFRFASASVLKTLSCPFFRGGGRVTAQVFTESHPKADIIGPKPSKQLVL